MKHLHEDETLPRVVRNVLRRDHYDLNKSSAFDKQNQNLIQLECALAAEFERMCPFWGETVRYDGRIGKDATSFIAPRTLRYSARYNLFLDGDIVRDNSMGMGLAGFQDLIRCMVSEFIYELAPKFEGTNKKFYPCIPARPVHQLDMASLEYSTMFEAIYYVGKPFDFDLSKSPTVPVTRPKPGFCGHLMQFPMF